MNYKSILKNILIWTMIFSFTLLPMKAYEFYSSIKFFPSIEVVISYFLYRSKSNQLVIYLYLFFNDLLHSNLPILGIICFSCSRKIVNMFENIDDPSLLNKLIKMLIYSFCFLSIKYLIISMYEQCFFSFFDSVIQIILTILVYPILEYILNFTKTKD